MVRKHAFDPDVLLRPRVPEAAYLLGLFWADGHLAKTAFSVTLRSADLDMLEPSFRRLGGYGYYQRSLPGGRQDQSTLYIHGRALVDGLTAAGYGAKSLDSACGALAAVPSDLHPHWFRGLMDGDGCFFQGRAHTRSGSCFVTGSYDQDWTYLDALGERIGVRWRVQRVNGASGSCSRCLCRGYEDVLAFGDHIYAGYDRKLGLPRKFEAFLGIKRYHLCDKLVERSSVSFEKKVGKWTADFKYRGTSHFVGRFKDQEVATRALLEARAAAGQIRWVDPVTGKDRPWLDSDGVPHRLQALV